MEEQTQATPIDPGPLTDFITYAGEVTFQGYEALCGALEKKRGEHAMLVLATPGGDPHAGFRIARALQHAYGSFDALVPRYCKSAGTLIVIGAAKLYLDDMSELGPLDIQVKKGDELVGRNSGLDIIQAVNYLENQAMHAFLRYLVELTQQAELSTKVASEISSKLTTGLFAPIASQIDPMRLAEMHRAMEIAFEYGQKLAEKSLNLREDGLQKLVTAYPSHGFVIDRKEARSIFIEVHRPCRVLCEVSKVLHAAMAVHTEAEVPVVQLYTFPNIVDGAPNENARNTSSTEGSHGEGKSSVLGVVEETAPSQESAANDAADEPVASTSAPS